MISQTRGHRLSASGASLQELEVRLVFRKAESLCRPSCDSILAQQTSTAYLWLKLRWSEQDTSRDVYIALKGWDPLSQLEIFTKQQLWDYDFEEGVHDADGFMAT